MIGKLIDKSIEVDANQSIDIDCFDDQLIGHKTTLASFIDMDHCLPFPSNLSFIEC